MSVGVVAEIVSARPRTLKLTDPCKHGGNLKDNTLFPTLVDSLDEANSDDPLVFDVPVFALLLTVSEVDTPSDVPELVPLDVLFEFEVPLFEDVLSTMEVPKDAPDPDEVVSDVELELEIEVLSEAVSEVVSLVEVPVLLDVPVPPLVDVVVPEEFEVEVPVVLLVPDDVPVLIFRDSPSVPVEE